ncbi:MAG: hypothetical protein AAFZ58_11285 [Pseudomonadota bacterium]
MLLWLASALAFATFCVHTFVGGREVARPLLGCDALAPGPRWLSYYCWHIATVVIFFIAIGYAYSARAAEDSIALVTFLSALAAALSALSVAVAWRAGINPLRFPSTSLFAATAATGFVALFI